MLMRVTSVDWGEIVWALIRKGVSVPVISQQLRVTRQAVIRWRDYGEPDYENGNALLCLWMEYHLPRKGRNFPDVIASDEGDDEA